MRIFLAPLQEKVQTAREKARRPKVKLSIDVQISTGLRVLGIKARWVVLHCVLGM